MSALCIRIGFMWMVQWFPAINFDVSPYNFIHIRRGFYILHLGLPDLHPDSLVSGTDPDRDPSIIKEK